jgi:osmotically inducible lipoprotein OsmB
MEVSMTKSPMKIVAILGLVALASCSGMNDTQQRTLSGAAAGTAIGAVGTVMTGGCVACGAAIGGAVGAAGGYVYDQIQKGNVNTGSAGH